MYKNITTDNLFHELVPVDGTQHRNLTVSNTAQALAAFNDKTRYVLVTVNTESIRFTLDGNAPTATDGHVLTAGAERLFARDAALKLKLIRGGSSDANVAVSELTR